MAAPIGNKNGLGNKGGGIITADRLKVATFKGLCLDWAIAVMQGNDEDKKRELVHKSIGSVVPREMQLSGDEENPVRFIEVVRKEG